MINGVNAFIMNIAKDIPSGYAPNKRITTVRKPIATPLIYGVAIGFLTVVIRTFGAYPEGMSFAIFIMNAFTPLINTYCKPKRFGEVVKK